jgi:hypothetical protein
MVLSCYQATARSLCMVSTAESTIANVAVVDSGEVVRSVVYSRYI